MTYLVNRIPSSPLCRIYQINLWPSQIFVKHFLQPKTYVINGFDLTPLTQRVHSEVSKYVYTGLKKNSVLDRYLPAHLFSVPLLNTIITTESNKNLMNLQTVIEEKHSLSLLPLLHQFTLDWFQVNMSILSTPRFLQNTSVWKLKTDLQLTQPLEKIMTSQKARQVINKLGPPSYLSHGDLQPKNLLTNTNCLRVVDFDEGGCCPLGWDSGFLWGNLLYLSGAYLDEFNAYFNTWISLQQNIDDVNLKYNFTLVTLSIFLMRINSFPLTQLSLSQKKALLIKAKSLLNYIK